MIKNFLCKKRFLKKHSPACKSARSALRSNETLKGGFVSFYCEYKKRCICFSDKYAPAKKPKKSELFTKKKKSVIILTILKTAMERGFLAFLGVYDD